MLVHLTGRKTGKHYRQPVSYVELDDALFTPGGGNWTRNLVAGEAVHIRLKGGDITARPDLIGDPGEIGRLFDRMAAANPALRRFIPIPTTPDGYLEPDPLAAAIDHGFRIVKWLVDRPSARIGMANEADRSANTASLDADGRRT